MLNSEEEHAGTSRGHGISFMGESTMLLSVRDFFYPAAVATSSDVS